MSDKPYTGVPVTKLSIYKKKPPGPKSKYVRKTFTDLRTNEGRELAEMMRGLENDLGENISAGQRIIMQSIAAKLAIVRAIYNWINNQESIIRPDGTLLPILDRNFCTYTGALQRAVVELYNLSGKRPSKTISLDDYLGQKSASTSEKTE